jgi:hypothetical protein
MDDLLGVNGIINDSGSGGSGGGGGTFVNDLLLTTVGGWGKYAQGQTVPMTGKTVEQVLDDVFTQTFYPTISNTVSNSYLQNNLSIVETGSLQSVTLTATLNRGAIYGLNQSGAWNPNAFQNYLVGTASSYTLNGVSGSNNSITFNNTTANGINYFSGSISYNAGVQPFDSTGANYGSPQPAGTISLPNNTYYQGIYPYFWGTQSTGTLPTASTIYGSNKTIAVSNGSLTIPFTGGGVYLWFAVPSGEKTFTTWYQTALNNGSIGGGSNLFASLQTQTVASTGLSSNYSISYDVYVTNYATSGSTLILN